MECSMLLIAHVLLLLWHIETSAVWVYYNHQAAFIDHTDIDHMSVWSNICTPIYQSSPFWCFRPHIFTHPVMWTMLWRVVNLQYVWVVVYKKAQLTEAHIMSDQSRQRLLRGWTNSKSDCFVPKLRHLSEAEKKKQKEKEKFSKWARLSAHHISTTVMIPISSLNK